MKKLYTVSKQPGLYCFRCPGCNFLHQISDKNYQGEGHKWDFNGDLEKPTFQPSYLLWEVGPNNTKENVCHSYITDGRIQFLNDCYHHLKGQTVDLPDIEVKE